MRRRISVGCIALALVAVAGVLPAAAASRASAKTICVGLVVDPRSIGGSVSDGCVTVKPGTTGVGVLEAAGHSLVFRADGLLCTIDGLPRSGCSAVDDSHYWAYFQRAPDHTSWTYSIENEHTYQPVNRSTEGWVYDDGSSLKPENIPAGTLCAALISPTATPSFVKTATARPAPSHTTIAPSSTRPAGATASPAKSAATGGPASSPSPSAAASGGAAGSGPDGSADVTASAHARGSSGSTGSSGSGGSGSATGAIITAAVIAVLIGATVAVSRRRR